MAWQIPTLAIGLFPRRGEGSGRKMGSKALADCARRDTIWHLARVLMKRFTFCLPVNFEVLASKKGCDRWEQQRR
jgi:hypothetical protein